MKLRRDLLTLAVVFGGLYFFILGRAPLSNPDEGRYAEIPREMVATGDWVTPRLDGIDYFEKPPLLYWAVAASTTLFGPSEGAMRAVPALFALMGVLLTYGAARRLYGRSAGLWSAAVLGGSVLYFGHARLLIIDMAVSVLLSACLFSFILAVREPPGRTRRLLFYGLYVSAALATLAKAEIGFLLPGAVMFAWLLLFNQWGKLRPLYLPTGIVLFLGVAAPWHLMVGSRNPSWAHFFFIHEQWERFTTTQHGRVQPWYFFFPVVLFGLFPWVGFLWSAGRSGLGGGWARRRENADAWFFTVWAVLIFLFFSKSDSKLVPYILPVFPGLALLIGPWLARVTRDNPPALRPGIRVGIVVSSMLAGAALAVVLIPGILHQADQALALKPYGIAISCILLAGAALASWSSKVWGPVAGLGVLLASVFTFYVVIVFTWPVVLGLGIPREGTKELALRVKAEAGASDRVFTYHEFFHDFAFYADRTVGVVAFTGELEPLNDPVAAGKVLVSEPDFRKEWAGPTPAYAVARKSDVKELFADPSFHYRLLGATRDHYLITNRP